MKCLRLCWLVPALALLLGQTPAEAQKKKGKPFKAPEGVEVLRDVPFAKVGGRELTMHVLRPTEAKGPLPAVVWVHGGGWSGGNKEGGLAKLAPYAQRGYLGATVQYRLSGEAPFPAQIEDVKAAIRHLRANAKKYNLDPDRIGVWGSSAGGHLVALLGTAGEVKQLEGSGGSQDQSSRVQAVCDFCGPTDLAMIVGKSPNAKGPDIQLLRGHPGEKKDLAELANPITHVSKDDPPFLIVHGDQDKTVPLNQSELLAEALRKAGVPVRLYVAEGQGHGLGGPEVARAVQEFFDRELKAKGK